MTILYDARRPVNPARPFAAGLLPPDPVSTPFNAPVTAADRARVDAADVEWIAANGGPSRPWETEVRRMLRSLAYPPCNVNDAVSWLANHGRADGCPIIDPEDWGAVNLIVARHLADTAADEATGGDIESDPQHWPAWTDDDRYELGPDPDDARWASEHLNETCDGDPPADHVPVEPESAAAEPDWDEMYHEAWAGDCLERGLDYFDPDLTADNA